MGIAHGSSGRLWGLVFNGVVPEAVQDARDGSWHVHLDKPPEAVCVELLRPANAAVIPENARVNVRQQQQEAEASSGAAVSGSDVPTVVTLPCMLKAAARASSRTGTTRTGHLGPVARVALYVSRGRSTAGGICSSSGGTRKW
eukprot:TRINITY_DN1436_c0_g1_i12.p2 TRINITY_DN1436_c0_g1~~TRINITY_DN1436_c0_g1_i12.p2  ORF type:complete len:143 (-),score=27.68 TRINITY_DN1436_c0_g1_i12:671-1099(-)